MKQLSKIQVNALAKKITLELNSIVNEKNSLVVKSDEYVNFFKNDPDCIILSEIGNKYNMNDYYISNYQQAIRNKKFRKSIILELFTVSQVENEIILETIDCDNINEVISKIKERLIKEIKTNE